MNGNLSQQWRDETNYSHKLALLWRDARRDADMSLKDVAEVTDVRVSYLSDFERGLLTPPLSVLATLFHAVGCNLQISAIPASETHNCRCAVLPIQDDDKPC